MNHLVLYILLVQEQLQDTYPLHSLIIFLNSWKQEITTQMYVFLPIFSIRFIIDLMKKQIKYTVVVCKLLRQ